MDQSQTHYVGGSVTLRWHIEVVDNGPNDVLWISALGRHVDLFWPIPRYAESVERLCTFSRVIIFDRRSTGARRVQRPMEPFQVGRRYLPRMSMRCVTLTPGAADEGC